MNKKRITIRLEPKLEEILKTTAKKHRISYTEIMTQGTLRILKQLIDKKSIFEPEIKLEELIEMTDNYNLNT
jgi:uncharacterized protein (DUF1778 family)